MEPVVDRLRGDRACEEAVFGRDVERAVSVGSDLGLDGAVPALAAARTDRPGRGRRRRGELEVDEPARALSCVRLRRYGGAGGNPAHHRDDRSCCQSAQHRSLPSAHVAVFQRAVAVGKRRRVCLRYASTGNTAAMRTTLRSDETANPH